jgi:hypothetical protein
MDFEAEQHSRTRSRLYVRGRGRVGARSAAKDKYEHRQLLAAVAAAAVQMAGIPPAQVLDVEEPSDCERWRALGALADLRRSMSMLAGPGGGPLRAAGATMPQLKRGPCHCSRHSGPRLPE